MSNLINEVDGNSQRYNSSKVAYSNIPPGFLNYMYEESKDIPALGLMLLAEHYTLATLKYPDAPAKNGHGFPNWAKGQLFEGFIIDSMLRHLYSYMAGEVYDEDFGSHHLVAVAWGFVALHTYISYYDVYKKFDDRKFIGFNFSTEEIYDLENYSDIINNCIQKVRILDYENEKFDAILFCYNGFVAAMNQIEIDESANYPVLTQCLDEERVNFIANMNYGKAQTANE